MSDTDESKDKRERLRAAGWRVGTVQEFLGLSDEELESVESRRAELVRDGVSRDG